jgi:uncharacterized protein (TIRG00374 family)
VIDSSAKDILKFLTPRRILLPILLGLGVAGISFYLKFNPNDFDGVNWTWNSTLWMFMALLLMVVRDWSYMYRIRVLTEQQISWRNCFDVIMLWEFASAVVPSVIGGGMAIAMLILNKEKIKMGKSISVIMFTSFLDGMFFALFTPLVYFFYGKEQLFGTINPDSMQQLSFGTELHILFWMVYFGLLGYKLIIAYALFINARAMKYLLIKIFSVRMFRKWRHGIAQTGTDMIIAAEELKQKNGMYWLKSFAATCLSWSARFTIINCIILAFCPSAFNHFLLYSRQVVMGVLMFISPTPGGAGIAEASFINFLGEFITNHSLTAALAFLWRVISSYSYYFIGAIIIPIWIKRVFKKKIFHTM